MFLADRLGPQYLVIGTTTGPGRTLNMSPGFYAGDLFADLDPPREGSLDALMAAGHDGPFAVDLRRLSPADADAVRAASEWRFGPFYCPIDATAAADVVVHLPRVSAADADPEAVAHLPEVEQRAFAAWAGR